MSSALVFPALRLPPLPDAAAPAPGDDRDVSMDLTAELTGIIDVTQKEARLRAQAWRFEQTFEERAE